MRWCFGFLLWVLTLGGVVWADPVRVFAAVSLGEVLTEIASARDTQVTLSLAGSGTIARQVAQGAPADVVILADPRWMDWLETRGAVLPGTRQAPFGNTLALIAPAGTQNLPALDAAALLQTLGPEGRLAMGHRAAVPAGAYAQAWLERAGLWQVVQDRLAETENVRAALALVSRAEAPLGIVYRTDLIAAGDRVTEIWPIPPEDQPAIRYAIAAVTPEGRPFAAALSQPEAQAILRRHGFTQ